MSMLVKVRVKTGAKREKIERASSDTFLVSVREKPERNMANRRMCQLLADFLTIPLKSVVIIKGQHSPSKISSIKINVR